MNMPKHFILSSHAMTPMKCFRCLSDVPPFEGQLGNVTGTGHEMVRAGIHLVCVPCATDEEKNMTESEHFSRTQKPVPAWDGFYDRLRVGCGCHPRVGETWKPYHER